jgi:hypothetical protein
MSSFSDVFHTWNCWWSHSATCFTLGIADEVFQLCVSLYELLKMSFSNVFHTWNRWWGVSSTCFTPGIADEVCDRRVSLLESLMEVCWRGCKNIFLKEKDTHFPCLHKEEGRNNKDHWHIYMEVRKLEHRVVTFGLVTGIQREYQITFLYVAIAVHCPLLCYRTEWSLIIREEISEDPSFMYQEQRDILHTPIWGPAVSR